MNNYYVSLSGSDNNSGSSKTEAVKTIEKAVKLSKGIENSTVIIESGEYYIDKPIMLGAENKGLSIIGDGNVIISGSKNLGKLKWEKSPYENILMAEIKNIKYFDRMFANEAEQTLCRYPNRIPNAVPLEGAASRAEIKERAKSYKKPEGGFVRAIHHAGWGGNSFIIKGKDSRSDCGLELEWTGDNNRGSKYGDALVVENIFEELDAEAEWFFDKNHGTLYWYPPHDINPNECEISVSAQTELLIIKGDSPENAAKGITVRNIKFQNTSKTLFKNELNSKAYEPLLRGDWCIVRSGAVYIENAENCTIEGCSFASIGGNAVFVSSYNAGHKIINNEFESINATAIQLIGKHCAVYQPSYWEHEKYPNLPVHCKSVDEPYNIGAKSSEYPKDVLIAENHISAVGLLEKQSCGINLSVCEKISIIHNTIHNSSRSLININDGTFGGHDIAYNDLFESQRETEDHGPFNSWGRDRFWSVPEYNAMGKHGDKIRFYKHNGNEYDISKIDSLGITHIHHNRFHHDYNSVHSWGIDLDDGSSNYEIDHNLILGIGIKLREGFDRNVHHNIIMDGNIQIHVPYKHARDRIYNNLILNSNPIQTAVCDKKRFINSEIQFKDNFICSNGKKIIMQRFFPKQIVIDSVKIENGEWITDIPQWEKFNVQYYGKKNCASKPPEYTPCFGRNDTARYFFKYGAICSTVTDAIRSSKAAPDNSGAYIVKIIIPSKSRKIKNGDIIRETLNGVTAWRESNEIKL